MFNFDNHESKLCPFKKSKVNFDSLGMNTDADESNLANASNAKIVREQFEHCDKEQCMAYDSLNDSCGLINKQGIVETKVDNRVLISKILSLDSVQDKLKMTLKHDCYTEEDIAQVMLLAVGRLSKYVECPKHNAVITFSVYEHKVVKDTYILDITDKPLDDTNVKPRSLLYLVVSNNFRTVNYNHVLSENRIELKR